MPHTPHCYICAEPLKKKGSVLVGDMYRPFLDRILRDCSGDVVSLVNGEHSSLINPVTMQYFHQFDLFDGEQRDDTLQVSWLMNPVQRFGIVYPRIPDDKCLFMIGHAGCLKKGDPVYAVPVADIFKIKNGVSATLRCAQESWFNKKGWLHMCTDLYGAKGAAELEHRSLL